jgi:hypothetical protein
LIGTIGALSDDNQKVDFWGPLFPYLTSLSSFADEVQSLQPRYIEACRSARRFQELARFLQSRPIDDSADDAQTVEYWTTIAEAWIDAGLPDARDMANAYRRAVPSVFPLSTPAPLLLRFRKVRAVYSIARAEYVKAGRDYVTIANSVRGEDAQRYLRLAIVYAILASGDPHGAGLMAELAADERIDKIPLSKFLRRFLERSFIRPDEVAKITEELKQERGFNQESLRESVLSHNLQAIAAFYRSITFSTLSSSLGADADSVLKLLRGMIARKKFNAVINQPERVVYFREGRSELEIRDGKIETFARAVQEAARGVPKSH